MQQLFQDKYKPKNITDFGFDNTFKNNFEMLIENNILNLLFIGHSGCGKTSFIEFIANTYYSNVSKDEMEENLLIINQMKDTSVQYFRQNMKIFCQSYCTIVNKKKLIVIDDIDNINEQCQQILRNYIDSYSNNVFFIFTCTTANKVINSIQSRLQIITLPTITHEHIISITNNICSKENIKIDEEAIAILIQISNLSLRRLYAFLQLFYLYENSINKDNIFKICNTISFTSIDLYFNKINNGNLQEAINHLYVYIENGYSCIDIYEHILIYLKHNDNLYDNFKYYIIQKLANYMCIFYEFHEDQVELALFTNALYCYNGKMYN